MPRSEVINTRRVRLMRRSIPRVENYVVLLIGALLVALVVWVMSTRNNFDATERDLPVELLYAKKEPIEIYVRPLKPWVEPGTAMVAGAFDYGAFPKSVADDDWQPAGRVKSFGRDNLYEKINGEAEKFIKQGFVSLNYMLLRSASSGAEMAIELFDQGDVGGSLGVFAEHAASREILSQGPVSFFMTSAGVIGRTGQHFFRVAADQESNLVSEKAMALVSAFAGLGGGSAQPTAADQPEGFRFLRERLGLTEAEIQFEESNVFQYDFANRFWFGRVGDDSRARLFVHIAEGSEQAESLLAQIQEEHGYEYDELPVEDNWLLYRHKFKKTHFVMGRMGRYVYGAEKLPESEQAEDVMRQLEEALEDG